MGDPDRDGNPGDSDSEPDYELGEMAKPGEIPISPIGSWHRLLFQPHLTSADRTRRAASLVALVVLSVLLLLAGSPGLRDGTIQLVVGWLPAPIPALGRVDDRFYLVPNVPWGAVLLDGHPLAPIPLASDGHPLRLARGQHTFEWRAAPFLPLRCQVSVPDDRTDVCWLAGQSTRLFLDRAPDGAAIIPAHDDLGALPVTQRAALLMATQVALEQGVSHTLIQPGERYAFLPNLGSVDRTIVAAQALRATLHLHLLSNLGVREPCVIGDPVIQPCRFPAQDCSQYCTLPFVPTSGHTGVSGSTWFASTFIWVSWDYDTLDGAPVAHNQGDPGVNIRLIDLGITWDGADWHVAPLFGHRASLPSIDDTICSAARVWLARGPLASLLPAGDATITIAYFSGAIPAAGCAVQVTSQTVTGAYDGPTAANALFLVRCGVLVAANEQARALWPAVPLADAPQQMIANQLLTQS